MPVKADERHPWPLLPPVYPTGVLGRGAPRSHKPALLEGLQPHPEEEVIHFWGQTFPLPHTCIFTKQQSFGCVIVIGFSGSVCFGVGFLQHTETVILHSKPNWEKQLRKGRKPQINQEGCLATCGDAELAGVTRPVYQFHVEMSYGDVCRDLLKMDTFSILPQHATVYLFSLIKKNKMTVLAKYSHGGATVSHPQIKLLISTGLKRNKVTQTCCRAKSHKHIAIYTENHWLSPICWKEQKLCPHMTN